MARSLPVYSTGTVTVAQVSGVWTVTGIGTNFLSPDGVPNYTLVAGDRFVISPNLGEGTVSSVTSTTSLTLDNWSGSAVTSPTAYKIYRFEGLPSSAVAALVSNLMATTAPVRTAVTGSSYQALSTDRNIAVTSLSAPTAIFLPAASSFPIGTSLTIFDETGDCSKTNTIQVIGTVGDLIDGQPSLAITVPLGAFTLQTNSAGKWTTISGGVPTRVYFAPPGLAQTLQAGFNLITNGTTTVVLGGANFTAANQGNLITIIGPGAAATELRHTSSIVTVVNAATVILATAPPTSMTVTDFSIRAFYGPDQSNYMQTFITGCAAIPARPYIPAGLYLTSQNLEVPVPAAESFNSNYFMQGPPLLEIDPGAVIIAMSPMTAIITYGSDNPDFTGYLRSAMFGGGTPDGNFLATYGVDVPFFNQAFRSNQTTKNTLAAGVRWGNISTRAIGQSSAGGVDYFCPHTRDIYTIPVISVVWSSGVATVTTSRNHGIPATRNVCLAGTGIAGLDNITWAVTVPNPNQLVLVNANGASWGAIAAGANVAMTMVSADVDFQIASITTGASTAIGLVNPHGLTTGATMPVEITDVQGVFGLVDGLYVFTATGANAGTLANATISISMSTGLQTITAGSALVTTGASAYAGFGWMCQYRDPATVEKAIYWENATDAHTDNIFAYGVRVMAFANPATCGWDGKHIKSHPYQSPQHGTMKCSFWIGGDNELIGQQIDLPFKFGHRFFGPRNKVSGARFNYASGILNPTNNYASCFRLDRNGPLAFGFGGEVYADGGGAKANSGLNLLSEVSVGGMAPGSPPPGYERLKFKTVNCTFTVANSLQGDRGGWANIARNGGMEVAQRQLPITISAGTQAYTLDGWNVSATGASVSVSQTGGYALTTGSLTITGQAGVTGCNLSQRLRASRSVRLQNYTATWQAKITNNTGAALTVGLFGGYPSATDNWGTTVSDPNIGTVALQTIPAGQTGLVAYTWNITNPYLGYETSINFLGQLNGAGKSVSITEVDFRVDPGAPVGLNSGPPTPEFKLRSHELVDCQAAYIEFFSATNGAFAFSAYNAASTGSRVNFSLPVPMEGAALPSVGLIATWTDFNVTGTPTITARSSQMVSFDFVTTSLGFAGMANPNNGGFYASTEL